LSVWKTYQVDLETGEVIVLSYIMEGAGKGWDPGAPSLSPNGKWLVYEMFPGPKPSRLTSAGRYRADLFLYDTSSAHVRRLTFTDKDHEYSPTFGGDSQHVYFIRARPSGRKFVWKEAVFRLNLSTGKEEELTEYETAFDWFPPLAVSPDGRYLAFSRQAVSLFDPRRLIYLVDLEATRPAPAVITHAGDEVEGEEPVFSPDGSVLYFVRDETSRSDAPAGIHLWSYSLKTGELNRVTKSAIGRSSRGEDPIAYSPVFGPSKNHIFVGLRKRVTLPDFSGYDYDEVWRISLVDGKQVLIFSTESAVPRTAPDG
jgi:Tol biopolymer transport system component